MTGPLDGNADLLAECIATREFRRLCSSSRGIGIENRIHEMIFITILQDLQLFYKPCNIYQS